MTLSDLQQLYQQIILDHAKARHGASVEPLIPLGDSITVRDGLRIAESYQVNPTCGDEVTVRVSISDVVSDGAEGQEDNPLSGRIEELVWRADGCSISLASASVLTDTVQGKSVGEARALLDAYRLMLHSRGTAEPDEEVLGDAAAFVGVSRYPARVKCAMLSWVAFEAALLTAELG